jgi:hypothetical protein
MTQILVKDYLMALDKKYDEVSISINYVDTLCEMTNKTNISDAIGSIIITDATITSIKTEIITDENDGIYSLEKINLKKGGAKWIGILVYDLDKNSVRISFITIDKDLDTNSIQEEYISSFCRV